MFALSEHENVIEIKRISSDADAEKLQDFTGSRPLIFTSTYVASKLGEIKTESEVGVALAKQLESFEEGLKQPTATKCGGRPLDENGNEVFQNVVKNLKSIH